MIRSIALVVLALVAVTLGVLYAREHAELQRVTARSDALDAQLRTKTADLDQQTAAAKSLTDVKAKLDAKVESTMKRLAKARAAAVAPPNPGTPDPAALLPAAGAPSPSDPSSKKLGGPMADYLAKMMKDPGMKQMLRSTQAIMQKQMYGDLVKQWGLTPDQASNFYDLLLDRQMATLDAVGQDPATVSAKIKESDDQLKTSLGDEMYGQYKDYEKSVGDRMLLSQFKQRLDSEGVQALTPDQSRFLINSMAQARAGQSTSGMFADGAASRLAQTGAFTDDDVARYLEAQTDSNEKVVVQASSMLTPAQLSSFKQYQTQMLEMQKAGLQMSAKMFSAPKGP